MKKNILINLDGYQLITLTNPLKKILLEDRNNFAFHCAYIEDKKKIKKNFSSTINIFCYEEFVKDNFNKINLNEYEEIIKNLDLNLKDIDRGFDDYSNYYIRPFISEKKKDEISIKRVILNYKFYLCLFKEFKPNIIIHEHSGGVGSTILWQLCKKINCRYFFFKGLYFDKKFFFLDHKDFSYPFFNANKLTQFSNTELENFKSEIKRTNNLAPFEKQSKLFQKINLTKSLISFFLRAKNYYKNDPELNYFYNRFPPILDNVIYNLFTKSREFFFKKFIQDDINLSKKYVVVYLQVEPELSTYSLNNKKIKFFDLIKVLSNLLPDDFKIYVKEHPSQKINSRFRSLSFFYKLKKIDKVEICPINFNSIELLKKSKFIVTGGGTIIFESIIYNIPSIVFGKNFYLNFKSIFIIEELYQIEEILKKINLFLLNDKFNEYENLNYALNIKYSMLDGHLFLSKDTLSYIKIENDKMLYKSLNKFINFIE